MFSTKPQYENHTVSTIINMIKYVASNGETSYSHVIDRSELKDYVLIVSEVRKIFPEIRVFIPDTYPTTYTFSWNK